MRVAAWAVMLMWASTAGAQTSPIAPLAAPSSAVDGGTSPSSSSPTSQSNANAVPGATAVGEPAAFRRVFAPTDRKQDWPFRAERYLPIPADDFERAVNATQLQPTPPAESALVEVRLSGAFDGGNKITGEAELTFRPPLLAGKATAGGDSDEQKTIGQLVPLSTGKFMLADAAWRDEARPVKLGTAADGATSVWVDRPGTLVGKWTWLGKVDAAGGIVFELAAPIAAVSEMSFTLPPDREAQLDGATLVSVGKPTAAGAKFSIRSLNERRRLRIVGVAEQRRLPVLTALRQNVDYEYSERGIDVSAQLRIDAVGEPLRRLEIDVDPTLIIVDARLTDRRLTWADVPVPKSPLKRIAIDFDPPLFGAGRTVLLRALAPAQVGKRQFLPTLRCATLDWRQGTMSLAVASPLLLERVDPTGCVAAAPTPLAGERPGEVVAFTCFDPAATARVLVGRVRDSVEVTSMTTISFDDEALAAAYRAELRVTSGERFMLQAGVPTRWIVDSVSTIPAGAISDWTVSEVRDERRWLTLRLAQALRPDRPLRLIIVARAARPQPGTLVRAEDLKVLDVRDARDDTPTAAVRSTEAWRLELEQERDETALTTERLDPLRRELLDDFAAEYLLDLRNSADPWRLRMTRRAARVEAAIALTAAATVDGLTERYRFRLTNLDDMPLERVVVRFQPAGNSPIVWSTLGDRHAHVDARRLKRAAAADGAAAAGPAAETWEVAFLTPPSDSIEFEALRESPVAESADVALAGIDDAVTQRGTVTVESDATTTIVMNHTTLTPLVVAGAAVDGTIVRGRFQYEPEQDVALGVPTRLTLRRTTSAAAGPSAIVWKATMRTTYEAAGNADYLADLKVQSFGADRFRWRFPDDAEHLRVYVDDVLIDSRSTTVDVPLPPRREFINVRAEFQTPGAARGAVRLVSVGRIDVDIPVFHVARRVIVPPEFALLDDASAGVADETIVSRLMRLAGPLLRPGVIDTYASGGISAASSKTPSSARPLGLVNPWMPDSVGAAVGAPAARNQIWTMRKETWIAVLFVAFAFGATIALRYLLRRRVTYFVTTGLIAALVTVLPATAAQVPTFVLLGILAATVANVVLPLTGRRWVPALPDGAPGASSHGGSAARRAAMTTGAVLACLCGFADGAAAQSTSSPMSTNEGNPVPEVFIPADASGKPTGERYLVPERLWRMLQARDARGEQGALQGTLISSAEYFMSLNRNALRTKNVVSEVRAVWTIEALRDAGEVIVPFRPFADAATAVLVDGRPIDELRTTDGSRLRIFFEKSGTHRVEAIARTAPDAPTQIGRFTLSVPRVLNTKVQLNAPAEINGLSIDEAQAAGETSEDRRTLKVSCVPSETLTVRWNDGPSSSAAVEFEQLELWRVRPGTVTVDVKLRLISKSPAGREVVFFADPRLQWLPRRNSEGDVADVAASPVVVEQATVGQRLRCTLRDDLQPDGMVEASFLVSGATGVGRLRLPRLRIDGVPATRRLFAYSVDPSLDYAFGGTAGFATLAIPEFERAWGAMPSLPQGAFARLDDADDWSVTTRPKPVKLVAAETQTLTCGLRRIDVAYTAALTISGSAVTRFELNVPSAIEVESVSAVDVEGEEQVSRWSRDDVGAVIVFLRTALRETAKLTLRGRTAVPPGGDLPFPFVKLNGTTGGEHQLRVVRLPDASVKVVDLKQVEAATTSSASESGSGRGRLAERLRISGSKPTAVLQIRENLPKVSARAVSTLRRDAQNWEFEFVAQLDVRAGLLDEIRLDLAPSITTPLTVTPAMPYEVSTLRDGRRRLVLHPRDALAGPFQFSLRSGLSALDREHPVPYVRLRQVESAEYFYQLPARTGVNRVEWDLEQLISASPPAGFAKPTTEEVVTFRAVGPRPSAVLRDVRRGVGKPFVRLADHRVRFGVDGEQGLTTFLVEPAGLTELSLRMPTDVETLLVRAGGSDCVVTTGEAGLLKLAAASDQLPHMVEVLYRRPGVNRGQGDLKSFVAPELDGLTVARTLWSVEADAAGGAWSSTDAAASPELRVAQARWEAYDAVLAELSADGAIGVVGDWARPLVERRLRARAELLRAAAAVADESPRRRTTTPVVEAGEPSPSTKDAFAGLAGDAASIGLDDVWLAASEPGARRLYATGDGAVTTFRLHPEMTIAAGAAWEFAAPTLCLLVAWLLFVWSARDGMYRWSRLTCALCGIAWIVFLQPPMVGWILIVAAVAARWHPSLRKARERRTAAPIAMRLTR